MANGRRKVQRMGDALVAGIFFVVTLALGGFVLILLSMRPKNQGGKYEQKPAKTVAALNRSSTSVVVGRLPTAGNRDVAHERQYYGILRSQSIQGHFDDYHQPGIDKEPYAEEDRQALPADLKVTNYFGPAFEEANKFYGVDWDAYAGYEPEPKQESSSVDLEINILTSPHTVGHCREHPEDCPRYKRG